MDFSPSKPTMNSDSDYEGGSQTPESSTCLEACSIEALIKRVDEYQRRDHMEAIERLTVENSLLQRAILKHQKIWCLTIELLEATNSAVLKLQKALEHCIDENIAAERQWLAFWGIGRGSGMRQNYSPAGWI
jgi:hypothetical protein